jgi:hypothetical protein
MKAIPKVLDWADREADRLMDVEGDKVRAEIASSLRRAAHNHLLFDAVVPSQAKKVKK